MDQLLLPALYALFVWWFSTGLVLYLVNLPPRSHRWILAGATAVAAAGFVMLEAAADDTGTAGAYLGFTAAILVWGWAEVTFLTGHVTGPRRAPCPEGTRGWRRTRLAIEAILFHELALAALGGAVLALSWGAANTVAAWTFGLLWLLRLSAKLNLFLGVPVLNEEMLPRALHHLRSYFRRSAANPLFPISVTAATAATTLLVLEAAAPAAEPAAAVGFALLATLAALGILEHWFMVLPLPAAALWSGALRGQPAAAPAMPEMLSSPTPRLNRSQP